MKVGFDSRPAKETRGVGRYARCLMEALRAAERGEIIETHDPKRCEVYHSPWMEGALLRSPVPMVVTLHDLATLKRRGEYLRSGLRSKLRYLAVQRAVHVIVPTNAVADDVITVLEIPPDRIAVIPEAAAAAFRPRPEQEVRAVRERFALPDRYLLWVGSLRMPDPRKRVAALVRAARTMPLVLVGRPVAGPASFPRSRSRERSATTSSRRSTPVHTRSCCPATTRGSGCPRSRLSPAGRPWPRATFRRCARCSTVGSRFAISTTSTVCSAPPSRCNGRLPRLPHGPGPTPPRSPGRSTPRRPTPP